MELIDKEIYEKYPCLYRAEDGACAACAYMCDCGWPEDCKVRKETVERQPTLTPPNEWVKVMEAINNAAVAYIEGGPYENDLPGMEFALKIDRLSRGFVCRPPEGEA